MPRKSKRGGGSQTEEERLLLQQRRAQTEEEVTRQREEMLTLFLKVFQLLFVKTKVLLSQCSLPTFTKGSSRCFQLANACLWFVQDKLQKDQRNAEVNLLKINDQWRTILRQTQGAELRGDLMVLSQVFEGHVDILNNIIAVRSSKVPLSWRRSSLTDALPVCRL